MKPSSDQQRRVSRIPSFPSRKSSVKRKPTPVSLTNRDSQASPSTPQTRSTAEQASSDHLPQNTLSIHSASRATPSSVAHEDQSNSNSFCDESTLASTTLQSDYQLTVIGTPKDFVYDRLYADAKRKNSSPSRIPKPSTTPRSSRSFLSKQQSPPRQSPKESVFERLYKNDASTSKSARRRSRAGKGNVSDFPEDWSAAKSLERRLSYKPVDYPERSPVGEKSVDKHDSDSVFERLYRNEHHSHKHCACDRCVAASQTAEEYRQQLDFESWSAATSLERRLGYKPANYPARGSASPSLPSPRRASDRDSIFERLYRNEHLSTSNHAQSARTRFPAQRHSQSHSQSWFQDIDDLSALEGLSESSPRTGRSVIEKRLGYIPKNFTAATTPQHKSVSRKTDPVVERLYRGERANVKVNYHTTRSSSETPNHAQRSSRRTLTTSDDESDETVLLLDDEYYWEGIPTETLTVWVTRIQKAWRRHRRRQEAAKIIQAFWRVHWSGLLFRFTVLSAIFIQRWWRKQIDNIRRPKSVQQKYQALVKIQQSWRDHEKRRHAAIQLQTMWRRYIASCHYQVVLLSTVWVQRWWRRTHPLWKRKMVLKQRQVQKLQRVARVYLQKYRLHRAAALIQHRWLAVKLSKGAAVQLQKHWRRYQVCGIFKMHIVAARVLQSWWCQRRQIDYNQLKHDNAVVIQAACRQYLEKRARYEYVVLIQTIWREYRSYKLVREEAAAFIQRPWRRHSARRLNVLRREACCRLQQQWGLFQKERLEASRSKLRHFMAIKIQRSFRRHLERGRVIRLIGFWRRKQVGSKSPSKSPSRKEERPSKRALSQGTRKQVIAASVLQIWWRDMQEKRFNKSALLLQNLWKQNRTTQKRENCAIAIQTRWRSLTQHKRFQEIRVNSLVLKMWWRRRIARRQTSAAIHLQRHWRMWVARQKFVFLEAKCIGLQVWSRTVIARRYFVQARLSAIKIQSFWRKALGRLIRMKLAKNRANQKAGATIIQALWRKYSARQAFLFLEARHYCQTRAAAITIQSYWRMALHRRSYLVIHPPYKKGKRRDLSSTRIQSLWRMWTARRTFLFLKAHCFVLQAWWRRVTARQRYHGMKAAAVKIQSYWRMALQVDRFRTFLGYQKAKLIRSSSATHIQSAWRMSAKRQTFLLLKAQVSRLQDWWRQVWSRRLYLNTRVSVVVVQSCWRMALSRQEVRQIKQISKNQAREASATIIQSCWRRLVAREKLIRLEARRFCQMRAAAISIQSFGRMVSKTRAYKAQKAILMSERAKDSSATLIQSFWRKWSTRQAFFLLRGDCFLLQVWWRQVNQRRRFSQLKKATIKVQSLWRMFSGKSKLQMLRKSREKEFQITSSALAIQSSWRAWIVRQEFLLLAASCFVLQVWWRQVVARRRFCHMKAATLVIQTDWRMFMNMCRYRVTQNALVRLQSVYRSYTTKKNTHLKSGAALLIQYIWRRHAKVKTNHLMRTCAICLQKHYRARRDGRNFLLFRRSIVSLQQRYRLALEKSRRVAASIIVSAIRRMIRIRHHSATRIQSCFRGHLIHKQCQRKVEAAKIIQSNYVVFSQRKTMRQAVFAVTKLQSNYRRHSCQCFFRKQKKAAGTMKLFVKQCLKKRKDQEVAGSLIQFLARRFLARKRSSVKIQTTVRLHLCKTSYCRMQESAIVIQSMYRVHAARLSVIILKNGSGNTDSRQATALFAGSSLSRGDDIRPKMKDCPGGGGWASEALDGLDPSTQNSEKGLNSHSAANGFAVGMLTVEPIMEAISPHYCAGMQSEGDQTDDTGWTDHVNLDVELASSAKQKEARAARAIQSSWRTAQQMKGRRMGDSTIQVAWRRSSADKRSQKLATDSATIIQKNARLFIYRTQYLRRQKASVIVQSIYRGHVGRVSAMFLKRYKQRNVSAIPIQRWWNVLPVKQVAASTIQSAWRPSVLARSIRAECATTIQTHIRRFICRTEYRHYRSAIIVIQSAYRNHVARDSISYAIRHGQQYVAARSIQRWLRTSLFRQRLDAAASKIQSAFRRFLLAQISRKLAADSACPTRIQASVRRFLSLAVYRRRLKLIIYVQSMYRGHAGRIFVLMLRQKGQQQMAVFSIQSWWKTILEKRRLHMSAKKIQTVWRRVFAAAKEYKTKMYAVTKIQANVRGFSRKMCYVKQHKASVTIQRTCRGHAARKLAHLLRSNIQRDSALRTIRFWMKNQVLGGSRTSASIKIQSFWRKHRLIKQARRTTFASATKIQATARLFLYKCYYLRRRKAALSIQSVYRGHVGRMRALLLTRHYQDQKEKTHRENAAVLIQKVGRVFIWYSRLNKIRRVAIILQRSWRRSLKRTQARIHYKSACLLQTAARRYLARQKLKRLRRATRTIYRFVVAASIKLLLLRLQCATVLASRSARGQVPPCSTFALTQMNLSLSSPLADCFLAAVGLGEVWWEALHRSHDAAALVIQRKFLARIALSLEREEKACTSIQAVGRRYITQKRLRQDISAAIRVQALFRQYCARHVYMQHRLSARQIQRSYRVWSERISSQRNVESSKSAAIKIQMWWKVLHFSNDRRKRRSAASKIWCAWKRFLSNRKTAIASATKIQTGSRRFICMVRYQRHRSAAVKIQSVYRSHILRVFAFSLKQKLELAAGIIQFWWKTVLLQKRRTVAASGIQFAWRRFLLVGTVRRSSAASTIILQANARRFLCRSVYWRHRSAVITIQSTYRGHNARMTALFLKRTQQLRLLESLHSAASTVQNTWRHFVANREVHSVSATRIQTTARRYLCKIWYWRSRKVVIAIQSAYRGGVDRASTLILRKTLQRESAAKAIQGWWRRWWTLSKLRRAAATIQLAWRRFVGKLTFRTVADSATKLQTTFRFLLSKDHHTRRKKAALVIQSWYRGYFDRVSTRISGRDTDTIPTDRRMMSDAAVKSIELISDQGGGTKEAVEKMGPTSHASKEGVNATDDLQAKDPVCITQTVPDSITRLCGVCPDDRMLNDSGWDNDLDDLDLDGDISFYTGVLPNEQGNGEPRPAPLTNKAPQDGPRYIASSCGENTGVHNPNISNVAPTYKGAIDFGSEWDKSDVDFDESDEPFIPKSDDEPSGSNKGNPSEDYVSPKDPSEEQFSTSKERLQPGLLSLTAAPASFDHHSRAASTLSTVPVRGDKNIVSRISDKDPPRITFRTVNWAPKNDVSVKKDEVKGRHTHNSTKVVNCDNPTLELDGSAKSDVALQEVSARKITASLTKVSTQAKAFGNDPFSSVVPVKVKDFKREATVNTESAPALSAKSLPHPRRHILPDEERRYKGELEISVNQWVDQIFTSTRPLYSGVPCLDRYICRTFEAQERAGLLNPSLEK